VRTHRLLAAWCLTVGVALLAWEPGSAIGDNKTPPAPPPPAKKPAPAPVPPPPAAKPAPPAAQAPPDKPAPVPPAPMKPPAPVATKEPPPAPPKPAPVPPALVKPAAPVITTNAPAKPAPMATAAPAAAKPATPVGAPAKPAAPTIVKTELATPPLREPIIVPWQVPFWNWPYGSPSTPVLANIALPQAPSVPAPVPVVPAPAPMPTAVPQIGTQGTTLDERDYVLNLAATVRVNAWKPRVGGGGTSLASTIDDVKPGQTIMLLLKPSASATAQGGNSLRVTGKVVAVDTESTPRQITLTVQQAAGTPKVDVSKYQVVIMAFLAVAPPPEK
jgi:hypothetical protein